MINSIKDSEGYYEETDRVFYFRKKIDFADYEVFGSCTFKFWFI